MFSYWGPLGWEGEGGEGELKGRDCQGCLAGSRKLAPLKDIYWTPSAGISTASRNPDSRDRAEI